MKGIRIITLFGLCLLISTIAYSQENDDHLSKIIKAQNSIDLSIGGTGLFASVNYNRIVLAKSNYFISTSAGIGIVPIINGITIPHQVTFNLGKKNNFLELGIGGSFFRGETGFLRFWYMYQLCPIIGYRNHHPSRNLTFRAYANPLFHISGEYFVDEYSVIPYFGISLGAILRP